MFERGVHASRIKVSNRTGSWVKPLTGARAQYWRPRWHPSGRRILYAQVALNGRADADLMLMSPRGRHKRVLLPGEGRNFVENMAWSPDGRRIAMVMDRGRISDLWVYTLSTGELKPLGVYRHPDRIPWDVDWSGAGVAFSAYDFTSPSEDSDVYLVQPDGSGLRQITDTPDRSERGPRFSPDGQRLLYVAFGRCGGYVVLANADGSSPERARGVGCHLESASWSPNMRRLLVVRYTRRDNWPGIWDMSIDGTRQRFITLGEDASWRPRLEPAS